MRTWKKQEQNICYIYSSSIVNWCGIDINMTLNSGLNYGMHYELNYGH